MGKMFSIIKNNKGFGFVIVLVVVLILLVTSISVMQAMAILHHNLKQDYAYNQLYFTAVSGIEYFLSLLNQERSDMLDVSHVEALLNREIRFPSADSKYCFILTNISITAGSPKRRFLYVEARRYIDSTKYESYRIQSDIVLTKFFDDKMRWLIWRVNYYGR